MGLTLMSDILIRNVLKKLECAEYVLQVITADRTLQVAECIVQKDYKNLQGRSAVLDCVARDTRGRVYDAEIQQESEGASPRRVRELKETQKESARWYCRCLRWEYLWSRLRMRPGKVSTRFDSGLLRKINAGGIRFCLFDAPSGG